MSDLVVADLTHALAGPHTAMMLADLGARVIKVEPPRGDEARGWGPPFVGPADAPVSTYYLSANRNKESVVADLRTEDGRELLARLVARADVLLENSRAGALDSLGFPIERLRRLNPALIVLAITGFGHDGPEAGRGGYDQIVQGEAGLMSVTGEPGEPTHVGVPIADLVAGLHGVIGVLAALHERATTGVGRVVRTSLLASVVGVHGFQGTRVTVAGETPTGRGHHHPSIAPYGLFHAADGTLQLGVASPSQWRACAAVVGLDADAPAYADNAARITHRDELVADIEAALSQGTRADWLARLHAAGVPAGVVRSLPEVYDWAQTRSQGLVVHVDHPVLGPVALPGPPLRFDDLPYAGGRATHAAPPQLGEHTTAVRAWLGMT